MTPKFTLVSTTYNEIKRLETSIQEIEAQSLLPSQIIIVDAGSKDGTNESLVKWKERSSIPIEIITLPGCNVAKGRNFAILKANTPLIVSTDFGCRYHPEWLQSLVNPFIDDPTLEVSGGAFSVKEEYIINNAQKSDYILQNGYNQKLDEYFSVSSRSIAYKKYVWEKIGGYPESLTLAADDTIFWRQVKRNQFRYQLVNKPYVYWLRHQTFTGFGKEAMRYGRGDGESGINFRSFVSNAVETTIRYSLLIHLLALPFYFNYWWVPSLFLLPQCAGLRSYKNAVQKWWMLNRKFGWAVLPYCFWMIEVTRINYLRGYLLGWLGRTESQKLLAKKLASEIK